MSYKEATPSCFRAYGSPNSMQKMIFGCCMYCSHSYPCNLKTERDEKPVGVKG